LDISTFKQAGATVKKAEKSIDAGIGEMRKRLEADTAGCHTLDTFGHPKCPISVRLDSRQYEGNSVADDSSDRLPLTWGREPS
jgi:hypothetical protein